MTINLWFPDYFANFKMKILTKNLLLIIIQKKRVLTSDFQSLKWKSQLKIYFWLLI